MDPKKEEKTSMRSVRIPKEMLIQRAAQTSFLRTLMQPDLPESKKTPSLIQPEKKTGLSKFLTGGAGSQMQVQMKRLS